MDDKQRDIRIHVATDYMHEQSEPDAGRYVFAYTITIANEGEVAAQLMCELVALRETRGAERMPLRQQAA